MRTYLNIHPGRLTHELLYRLSLHFFSRRADNSGTVMSVPEPDSRVVPLERPFRTEREPVTYEPRRIRPSRHHAGCTFIDVDVAPGERPRSGPFSGGRRGHGSPTGTPGPSG